LTAVDTVEVTTCWEYAEEDSALRARLSAGPAVRAIAAGGEERVGEAVLAAIAPYRTEPGGYRLENAFRYVVAGVS
jgi:hypothetical protein